MFTKRDGGSVDQVES